MYFTLVPLIYVNNIDICQLIQYLSFKFLFNQKHFLLSFFLIKTHFRIILEFTSKTPFRMILEFTSKHISA